MDKEKDFEKKGDGKEDAKELQMLRAAVHYTVYKISEEVAAKFTIQFSKETVLAISDHVFRNMEHMGHELELFAKHAKRTKINPDDVKLLFRNSPDMGPHLDGILKKREEEKRAARPLPAPKTAESKKKSPENPKKKSNTRSSKSVSPEVESEAKNDEIELMDFDNDF